MTALIYGILIVVWAVVLVPRFLRNHDETRRRREAERVEAVLAPELAPDDGADTRAGTWGEYLRSLTSVDTPGWMAQVRFPQGQQARRRRKVLLGMSVGGGVSILGAMVGILPGFLALLSLLLIGGYLGAMFMQMRAAEQRGADRRSSSAQSAQRWEGGSVADHSRSTDGVRVMQKDPETGPAWAPVKTTLPTYVNQAKAAPGMPPRINLTDQVGWTGAGMIEEARRQRQAPQPNFEQEFEAVQPNRDAVEAEYAYPAVEEERYYRRAVNE